MLRIRIWNLTLLHTFFLIVAVSASITLGTRSTLAADAPSCAINSANRQLDFWLGDWTVSSPGASTTASSKVTLALDQCMLIETWTGGHGHTGQNVFAYSADDKNWHGFFADNQGRVHVFLDGKVTANSAQFSGPSLAPNGEVVINRVTIARIGQDKVEQIWRKSSDDGATWSTEFQGEYSRRKP
jgi:hypothetical protein